VSERFSKRLPERPGRSGRLGIEVFDATALDRTLEEDWSRYTRPAADVRARGLRMRRVRRFWSSLGATGAVAAAVVVLGFGVGRGGLAAATRPAAGAPVPSASGLPTPPAPQDGFPGSLAMTAPIPLRTENGMNVALADAAPIGKGEVDGHEWEVWVRVVTTRSDLAAQAPDIGRLASSRSDGPVALIAHYENQRLGAVRPLVLSDSAPIIPDGRGTVVDPWFSSLSGVVTGQVGATVARLRVTAGGRDEDYPATSIGGYHFIAFPVSAAAPVTRIVAVDETGKEIGSGSGRFVPDGVFDSAHPELNFGTPAKKG
jgi:hypothetical protein